MRLIDADALEKRIDEFLEGVENANYVKENWMCVVDEQPTIDAEPIRHGRWIISDIEEEEKSDTDFARLYECSACHVGYIYRTPEDITEEKYCYNCGAKMDEVEE